MSDDLRTVLVRWDGGMRFRGGAPGGPSVLIDADAKEAPGPMLVLLCAVAACSGADVLGILEKARVKLSTYEIEVLGRRAPEIPKRFLSIHLKFRLGGEGLDEGKARRAIDLSLEKYCSVVHSLKADIPITYELAIS